MANKRSNPALAALRAKLERASAGGETNFDRVDAAFAEFVAKAPAGGLWEGAALPPIDEAVFVEDEIGDRTTAALVARMKARRDLADAADALAILARAAAFDPFPFLAPGSSAASAASAKRLDQGAKAGPLGALRRESKSLISALESPSGELRQAAALALARLPAPEPAAAAALAARIGRESEALVCAALILALGAVGARRGKAGPAALLAALAGVAPKTRAGAPVSLCAAGARALVGEPLDEDDVAILARTLKKATALPAAWGARWADGDESSAGIAVRVAAFAKVPPAPALIEAIGHFRGAAYLRSNAAWHLAFADGEGLSPAGLAASELTPLERAGVELVATGALDGEHVRLLRLGFSRASDAALFLAETGPLFRPIAVPGAKGSRHFVRLGRETLHLGFSIPVAAAALAKHLGPQDLARALLSTRGRYLLSLPNVGPNLKAARRETEFYVECWKQLSGASARAEIEAPPDEPRDPWALAVAIATSAGKLPIDARWLPALAQGSIEAHEPKSVVAMIQDPRSAAAVKALVRTL